MVPTALRARWELWARPVSLAWAARQAQTAATATADPRVATATQVTAVFLEKQLRTAPTVLMVPTAVMVSRAKTDIVDIPVRRSSRNNRTVTHRTKIASKRWIHMHWHR